MTNPNDLAYPVIENTDGSTGRMQCVESGLTKREYFAANNNDPVPDSFVLKYIRDKEKIHGGYRKVEGKYWDALTFAEKVEVRATWRVKSADALIKALNEPQP